MTLQTAASVHRFGASGAPVLLCLHGFGDEGRAFAALADSPIAEAFELAAPDLPGFGASPPIAETTISGLAAWTLDLADKISPDRPLGLLAHSVGAAIAVEAAIARPDRVAGLISLEGNLASEDAYYSGRAADFDTSDAFKIVFAAAIAGDAARDPALSRYAAAVAKADADALWTLGRDAALRGAEDGFGRAYLALVDRGLPNLYLWSHRSITTGAKAFIARHDLPHLEILQSGHWLMVDQPQTVGRTVQSFFARAFR